jgi:hypothetical protein
MLSILSLSLKSCGNAPPISSVHRAAASTRRSSREGRPQMDMPLGLGVAGMVTGYDVKQKTIEHEVLLDIYIYNDTYICIMI